MTLQTTHSNVIFNAHLDWVELPVTVFDTTPDEFVLMNFYSVGTPLDGLLMIVNTEATIRIPRLILPSFVSLIGQKRDESAAYIALNVDLYNAVVLNLYAVKEATTGGSGGEYRVAGTTTINAEPVQRNLVIISDDPTGREIIGAGQSENDGAFDLTYSGWDGAVIVLALDEYGVAFTAETPLNAGTVVHPTAPNGYVYVVTEAGETGSSEPTWSTTSAVVSGSVTFAPRTYYRPVASGPLQGALVE